MCKFQSALRIYSMFRTSLHAIFNFTTIILDISTYNIESTKILNFDNAYCTAEFPLQADILYMRSCFHLHDHTCTPSVLSAITTLV